MAIENSKQLISVVNPILQSYHIDGNGMSWTLSENTRLIISDSKYNNSNLENVVKLFNSELLYKGIIKEPLSMIFLNHEKRKFDDIFIDLNSDVVKESVSHEAYAIRIDYSGIILKGRSVNAVLYALRTIQNILIVNKQLPFGEIVDYPDVHERRLHVDIARKYISKDWIIQTIREMSYMKLNTLQLHFSENHGFRIESEVDPSIVSDVYLTKDEVREIISEADKYCIDIIPSLDSPGHVDQILRAHPEYGQIDIDGNHYKSGLDVTNPEAIKYIKTLYSEYMDLFKESTVFHIGGDEYMEFDREPFISKYKDVLNTYAKENFSQNFTWKDTLMIYVNDIAKFVYDRGFIPRVWNDGLYYGEFSNEEPAQKVVMHDFIEVDFWSTLPWNKDIAQLTTFIEKGHKSIYNVNSGLFYYVLRAQKPTDGRKQHSFDFLNSDKRIFEQWTPGNFPEASVADDSEFIKGVSMAIWCDVADVATEETITEDIANELRALASKSWNIKSNSIVSFDEFRENYMKLGNVAGFKKGSNLPEVGDFDRQL